MPVSVQVQLLVLLSFAALIMFVPSFRTGTVTAQVAWNCFFQLNVLSRKLNVLRGKNSLGSQIYQQGGALALVCQAGSAEEHRGRQPCENAPLQPGNRRQSASSEGKPG